LYHFQSHTHPTHSILTTLQLKTLQRKRREEDSHPLDGSIKKRQKLFSGFSRNKKGALNEDFDNEEGKPNFIEIGEHNKRTNSYAAPRNLVDDNSEYSR
jgi:hypothetical protein